MAPVEAAGRAPVDEKGRPEEFLVGFAEDEAENPLHWSAWRKRVLVGLMSTMTLLVSLATLMSAPASPRILRDFRSDSALDQTLIVSIWELGEAVGPLLSAPLSEIYGRAPLYHAAMALFFVCSVACALSTNIAMFLAFRFLNGAAVVSVVLNPSVVGDLFAPAERGNAIAIMGLPVLLGPVIGPLIGGYLAEKLDWRWLFWLAAIIAALVEVGLLLFLRETYADKLLRAKAARLRKATGDPRYTARAGNQPSKQALITTAILRPGKILLTSPPAAILAVYVSLMYGYLFLLFTTLAPVFQQTYAITTDQASLTFLGIGIGLAGGTLVCRNLLDRWVKRMKDEGQMFPEQRLYPMMFGSVMVPLAFVWYGWTVAPHIHWIIPIIATALVAVGVIAIILSTTTYLLDAFGVYAASAIAGNMATRCIVSAVLPLVAPPLYGSVGIGWGSSILGLIALLGIPVPLLLFKFGARMRQKRARVYT